MAHLQKSDVSRRHRFIDASLTNLESTLNSPYGEFLTVSEKKIANYVINHFVVPNRRDSQLVLPANYRDEEFVPIYAVDTDSDKTYTLDSSLRGLHPLQYEHYQSFLSQKNIDPHTINHIETALKNPYERSIGYDPSARGYTHTPSTIVGVADDRRERYYLKGRPLIMLQRAKYRDNYESRTSPDHLYHETVHVIQALGSGAITLGTRGGLEDVSFRNELEAYGLQTALATGMAIYGYEPDRREDLSYEIIDGKITGSLALTIDSLRRQFNAKRDDKYFPDSNLRKHLLDINLSVHSYNTGGKNRHLPAEISTSSHVVAEPISSTVRV